MEIFKCAKCGVYMKKEAEVCPLCFKFTNFRVGDKVVLLESGKHRHISAPEVCPPVGTTGIIKGIMEDCLCIKWEDGSTSLDDVWHIERNFVEKVL